MTHDTAAMLDLAWQLGRTYERNLIAAAADDIGRVLDPPTHTREERIALRMEQMHTYAATHYGLRGRQEWRGLERGDQVVPW